MAKRARVWKTEGELRAELERDVERYPTDSAAAKALGVSRSHLCRVLSGQKPITERIAHSLGYEQQRCFVRYEHRN